MVVVRSTQDVIEEALHSGGVMSRVEVKIKLAICSGFLKSCRADLRVVA